MNINKKILSQVDETFLILEDGDNDTIILEDEPQNPQGEKTESFWKILLVDDDLEVHQATKLILKYFTYAEKYLKFISAYSGTEAKELIRLHPDTAVIFLDVVMETKDAGLKVAQYIRLEAKNYLPRIILRTGQPGEAPEETVIINYEIDDYKTKTELTQQRLFVTMVAALKSYQNALELEASQQRIKLFTTNLEALVIKRTQELEAANQQLKNEIAERQKTETALRESQAKFQGIVELSMSAIISIDEQQVIQLFNQGAETIFGYTPEEVLGKPLDMLLPVAFRQSHEKYVQNFENDSRETRKMGERSKQVFGRRKNGEEFPAEASISKLKLHSGTIFTVMLRDISDRVEVEKELLQTIEQQKAIAGQLEKAKEAAETANRAKSEFLANMSHEIRTPLNAILGFSNLLKGTVAEAKAQTYVKSIASSGKALLSIINDILDLSKIEAGRLELHYEPVNLRLLIEEIQQVFSEAADRKHLSLLADIAETVPLRINCDEVRLRQILFNLVGNAIKFTEKGYVKIKVAIAMSIPPIIEAENNPHCSLPDLAWLEMAVEDTGIGIATEQQQRIFGSFVQSQGQSNRKYGGSGLGLAITKRLTEKLGGAIELKSALGEGTTFTCYFPAITLSKHDQMEALVAPSEDEDLEQFPPLTVLVVDDVESNLELIGGYFAGSKHQLLKAKDGLEAIAIANEALPDIIFMDLRMPNMNGWEAIRRLRQGEATKDIPIAILSASAQESELEDLRGLYSGFLLKPISRSEVIAQLKKNFPLAARETVSAITSPPAPEEIKPLNLEKLPELLAKLRSCEEELWPQLIETMKMRELREFADRLKQWGLEYEYSSLVDYASMLETQIEEFDWSNLPETVAAFPEVGRSLESLIKI